MTARLTSRLGKLETRARRTRVFDLSDAALNDRIAVVARALGGLEAGVAALREMNKEHLVDVLQDGWAAGLYGGEPEAAR